MKSPLTFPIACLLAALIALAGCSQESTAPLAETAAAPALPPVETMSFDLGFFADQEALSGAALPQTTAEIQTKFHWLNAVIRVALVEILLAEAIRPPVLAFQAAVSTRPTVEEPGSYRWTYTWIPEPGHEVTINLRAYVDGPAVDWEMRVSDDQYQPPLDDFLWFHGRTNDLGANGYWIFRDIDPQEEFAVARIEWSMEALDQRELSFENIKVGAEEYGDQLSFTVRQTRRTLVFDDASEELEAEITWDVTSGAGSLTVPDYHGGQRACWDGNQEDCQCPDDPAL